MLTGLFLASIEVATTGEGSNQLVQIAQAFGVKPYLLLAQMINFALVAWILHSLVLKPIQKQLDARAQKIDEGLKQSELARQTLAQAQQERDALILEARKHAQQIVDQSQKEITAYEVKRRLDAEHEAVALREQTLRTLALEQEQAIKKAQDDIAQVVINLAQKGLAEELTPEQKERFAARATATLTQK